MCVVPVSHRRPAQREGPHTETAGVRRGQYSAERMALAVLGAQPLPELEEWVRELFAAVPSGAGPRPTFPTAGSPYEARPGPDTMHWAAEKDRAVDMIKKMHTPLHPSVQRQRW